MRDRKSLFADQLLPTSPFEALHLQLGMGLVPQFVATTMQAIVDLRKSLEADGLTFPRVRIQSNDALPTAAFVLLTDGRVVCEGEYPSDGDILQAIRQLAQPIVEAPIHRVEPSKASSDDSDTNNDAPNFLLVN